MVFGAITVVPRAIFDFGKSNLVGNRRGPPSGDLVFASTGASARRLFGDAVFIVFYLIWVRKTPNGYYIFSIGKVVAPRVV